MKVVFFQDVPNVARAGDIKEVADGYARNFLIPRQLAALATPEAMSRVTTGDVAKARTDAELVALAKQLDGQEVNLKAHAGAKDRLYGSVTSADIAAELERVTKITVDKRKIELDKPIHHLGSYEVAIHLGKDILPKIKVNVAEEEEPAKEEKKKAAKADKKAKPETKAEAEAEAKPKKAKTPAKKATKATTKKKAETTKGKKAAEKKAAPKKKAAAKTTKAKATPKKEES
jgi:large subunit ribosomal protein L9